MPNGTQSVNAGWRRGSFRYNIHDYLTQEQYDNLANSGLVRALTGRDSIHGPERDLMALLGLFVGGTDTLRNRYDLRKLDVKDFFDFLAEHPVDSEAGISSWQKEIMAFKLPFFSDVSGDSQRQEKYGDSYRDVANNAMDMIQFGEAMHEHHETAKIPSDIPIDDVKRHRTILRGAAQEVEQLCDPALFGEKELERQAEEPQVQEQPQGWEHDPMKVVSADAREYLRANACGIVFDKEGKPHNMEWLKKQPKGGEFFIPNKDGTMCLCKRVNDDFVRKLDGVEKIKHYDYDMVRDSVDRMYKAVKLGDERLWFAATGSDAYKSLKEKVKDLREFMKGEAIDNEELDRKLLEVKTAAQAYYNYKVENATEGKAYAPKTQLRMNIAQTIEMGADGLLECQIGRNGQEAVRNSRSAEKKQAELNGSLKFSKQLYDDTYRKLDKESNGKEFVSELEL